MTREQIVSRRDERLANIARILYAALDSGDTEVRVVQIPALLPQSASFKTLSMLHRFLRDQPLTLNTKKRGPGRGTYIPLDSLALSFITNELDKDILDLLKMRPARPTLIPDFMSRADFYQKLQDIPDFAPMGDPVFTQTQATRI